MRTTRSRAAISVLVTLAAVLGLGALPTYAAASDQQVHSVSSGSSASEQNADEAPQEVVEILTRRQKTGKPLSASDRATILKYPKIAEVLVDPDQRTPMQHETIEVVPSPDALAAYCVYQDRYINYYNVIGTKVVEWHHKLYYCIDDNDNVKRSERTTYLDAVVGNWERGGYSQNSEVGNGTPYYSSAYEEKIRQCQPGFPCADWAYPYSKFVVNGHTHNVDYYWRRG